MMSLGVFAFLQGAASVAMGADVPFVFLPSQRAFPQAIGGGAGQFIPYMKLDFNPPVNGAILPVRPDFKKSASLSNESSFAEWSGRVCKQGLPVVDYFVHYYTKRVKSSDKLRKAYLLNDFTAESLSSSFYRGVLSFQTELGNPNARESATVISRAIRDNFHKVQDDSLILMRANQAAKYLFYRGALNASNALTLAQQVFAYVKRKILSVKNPTPRKNFSATGVGFDDFLNSTGLLDEYSGMMVVATFASEWYALDADESSACQCIR